MPDFRQKSLVDAVRSATSDLEYIEARLLRSERIEAAAWAVVNARMGEDTTVAIEVLEAVLQS